MGKITDLKTVTEEQQAEVARTNFWILTTRTKKTKAIQNVVFSNPDLVKDYIAKLKNEGRTFITLTNEERVRTYLNGETTKDFQVNINALSNRKVPLSIKNVYAKTIEEIDTTNRLEGCLVGYMVVSVLPPTEAAE
jgi:hypothetical protein